MNRRTPRAARLALLFAACLFLTGLSGCSMFKFGGEEEEEVQAGVPPATRLREGMEAYDVGKYGKAVTAFTALLEEHPFSPEAGLAELKLADAYYYDGKYDEAKEHYKEFETRHPTNEAIPYVLFQYGMCDYAKADRTDRDPNSMAQAINSFTRLLNAAPHSAYAQEATIKIREAQEFLADHEFRVAKFYTRTGKPGAARQRLQYLLATYPNSNLVPRAQELLAEIGEPEAPGN